MDKTTNQEEVIFLAALELESSQNRAAFLQKKCHGDAELLGRVEELLRYHEQGDNLLDDTSGGFLRGATPVTDSIRIGSQVGPYKLLQELGLGGMGVVYMAEQVEPVRRKVAIKIIKLGMDTRNVIARFEAERQALAMMDHPNITKVFDAGCTTTGRPYFVMELVTGLAITDYCDRERLSLRARMELFYQVCVGVKHAHQKGIIHRDLKPSNVMVTHYDGEPVPKIIDFGIAKAVDQTLTEKTLFTSYGNMIGTPEYMSPEQAEMSGQDIDTRADVYSLGVLMYELLTGTTPFYLWKKKGIHKFCEAVCHEEPELASTRVNNLAKTVEEISRNRSTDVKSLKRVLRGDMDWILAKCMSKNRSDRYETAADLARDVKRYLAGQPVEAVGPNMSYRARKFARKHRTSLAVAAVVAFTLVTATIVSTAFAFQAHAAQQLANKRLKEVDQLRQSAVNERDRALAAESKLQRLERWRRNETAAAVTAMKFNQEFPNEAIEIRYPNRQHKFKKPVKWAQRHHGQNQPGSIFVFDHAVESTSPDVEMTPVETGVDGDAAAVSLDGAVVDVENTQSFKIVIGAENEFTFRGNSPERPVTVHRQDPNTEQQYVVIQENGKTVDRRRFLKILANVQREMFGPDDGVVANTLIEIGNTSLEDEDWSNAENYLREGRDILKLHQHDDAQQAKVELLLSKSLLHQKKHAEAKRSLQNGFSHLVRLRELPPDLVTTIEELEQMEIPVDLEINLKKELKDKKIKFQLQKKK